MSSFPVRVHDAGGHSDGGPGRYVETAVSLAAGHTVLRAKAFHVGVMDSHRKVNIYIFDASVGAASARLVHSSMPEFIGMYPAACNSPVTSNKSKCS